MPRQGAKNERARWPEEPREGYTAVGRVLRPHGLGGDVRVKAFSETGVNVQGGRTVFLDGVRREVLRSRADKDAWVLQLEGITNRTAAEEYRGALLEVPDDEVARESEDSYFVHELIGLRVVTSGGEELGTIAEVMQPGANDVYVVQGPRGEILVPVIADVIDRIDVTGGVVVITPLAGMLDESR